MMSFSRKSASFVAVAVTATLLSACSSGGAKSMDVGERMSARGASIAGRGEAWSSGQRDVTKGQQLINKSTDRLSSGEKDLRKAQERVTKAQRDIQTAQSDRVAGERLVSDGMAQMQRAEADYSNIRTQPSAVLRD